MNILQLPFKQLIGYSLCTQWLSYNDLIKILSALWYFSKMKYLSIFFHLFRAKTIEIMVLFSFWTLIARIFVFLVKFKTQFSLISYHCYPPSRWFFCAKIIFQSKLGYFDELFEYVQVIWPVIFFDEWLMSFICMIFGI